jgi:two-component system, LytTR family, response regulator
MRMKAVIIDDELTAREMLSGMVEAYAKEVEIAGLADSIDTGAELIKKVKPDVVFLDVGLAEGTGFDLLERFEDPDFEVIFTTAYNKYALQAIKFSALDYLLKPISPSELKAAMLKLKKRKEKESSYFPRESFKILSEGFQHAGDQTKRITLSTSEGIIVVQLNQVIRCEGFRNYTTFYLTTGKSILVSRTLKEFEEMLEDYGFLRIFQSHLVNLSFVKKYNRGRVPSLEMADGSVLPVSRDKKNLLLQKLKAL